MIKRQSVGGLWGGFQFLPCPRNLRPAAKNLAGGAEWAARGHSHPTLLIGTGAGLLPHTGSAQGLAGQAGSNIGKRKGGVAGARSPRRFARGRKGRVCVWGGTNLTNCPLIALSRAKEKERKGEEKVRLPLGPRPPPSQQPRLLPPFAAPGARDKGGLPLSSPPPKPPPAFPPLLGQPPNSSLLVPGAPAPPRRECLPWHGCALSGFLVPPPPRHFSRSPPRASRVPTHGWSPWP